MLVDLHLTLMIFPPFYYLHNLIDKNQKGFVRAVTRFRFHSRVLSLNFGCDKSFVGRG